MVVLGLAPLLLMHWDDRHGHHVPKWLLLLSAAPLVIALMLNDGDEEAPGPLANFLLFVMGLFGVGMGVMGFALRDAPVLYGLGGFFIGMVPVGLIMAIAALVRGLRD